MRRIVRVAADLALSLGALVGVACLVAAVGAVAFGVHPLIFRSGSMAPTVPAGSLAFARDVPATDIRVGDVVSVPWHDSRVTHRVVEIFHRSGSATLKLKGDANDAPDAELYQVSSAPRVWFSVPVAGRVVAWLSRAPGVFVLAAYAALLLTIVMRRFGAGGGGRPEEEPRVPSTQRRGRRRAGKRRPTRRVRLLSVAVTALAVGAVTASPTWAAWGDAGVVTGTTVGTGSLNPPTNMTCSGGGVLASPTLSWTPPTGGATPNQYTVTYRSGSATGTPTRVTTTSTSWQMPNGILSLLATYYISVQSSLSGTNWVSASANPGQTVNITSVLGLGAVTSCAGSFTPTS